MNDYLLSELTNGVLKVSEMETIRISWLVFVSWLNCIPMKTKPLFPLEQVDVTIRIVFSHVKLFRHCYSDYG